MYVASIFTFNIMTDHTAMLLTADLVHCWDAMCFLLARPRCGLSLPAGLLVRARPFCDRVGDRRAPLAERPSRWDEKKTPEALYQSTISSTSVTSASASNSSSAAGYTGESSLLFLF